MNRRKMIRELENIDSLRFKLFSNQREQKIITMFSLTGTLRGIGGYTYSLMEQSERHFK